MMRLMIIPGILSLLLMACSTETGPVKETLVKDNTAETTPASHLGGCILLSPLGSVPEDPYQFVDVHKTTTIQPFTKELNINGISLAARDDISDEFMRLVAMAIAEIFPQDEGLDLAVQREVIEKLHLYNALIPVPLGDDFSFMENNPEIWAGLESRNSICDIIMQDVPGGQVMEVVEHILHFVSDIGLHYTYPDVWGISPESELAKAMQLSVDNGYYDVSGYDDIDQKDIRFRVEMQEFAYWFISTAWDLQEPYGPKNEQEWLIKNNTALQRAFPEFYASYEQTVGRIMVPPSMETLRKIGPTRLEE